MRKKKNIEKLTSRATPPTANIYKYRTHTKMTRI